MQANLGISHRIGGVQLSGRWRSATSLRAGATSDPADLRFSPLATVNLQVFAELEAILSQSAWAKGLRATIAVSNVFDDSQVVRDRAGLTPLRYQRYLIEPLGRTVGLTLRKAI